MMHAFDIATSEPWLITEEYLRIIAAVASRSMDPESIDALGARQGVRLMNTRTVQIRSGVAIVPVTGPIFRYANLFTEISGATSTEILARDFRMAVDDPLVKAIVLDINSPGGMASGINELGDMVFEARAEKRIVAYAGGQMASAAYWIGSAAHETVIDKTAMVGSIGAIMSIVDSRGKDERAGVRTIQIVSSQSPDKNVDPSIDEGRAKYQKIVDDLAAVFIAAVARNREVTLDTVLRDFGQGGQMVGQKAVDAGLADRLGSLEQVVQELANSEPTRRSIFMSTERKGQAKGPITVATTAELQAALAAGHTAEEITIKATDVEALKTAAKSEGEAAALAKIKDAEAAASEGAVKAERERIAGLHAIAIAGFETEIAEAIKTGASVGDTAIKISTAAKDRGVTLGKLQAEGSKPVNHGGSPKVDANANGKSWGTVAAKVNKQRGKRA